MRNEKENITQLKNAVSTGFEKFDEFTLLTEKDFNTIDELRKYLSEKLSALMIKNFDEVLKILYRIDINENNVQKVIHSKNEYKANLLADLIIERQMQKIKTRQKYKSSNDLGLLD